MKKKLLIFHPTIAPYRIDLFNDLFDAFESRVVLYYHNLKSQKFDYSTIESQFHFTPKYLKETFIIGKKYFYSGYWKELKKFNPNIVITEEFGIGTLLVLIYRFLLRKKFKVVSICDDSYNMVAENNDFSKIHKIARRLLTPMIDELILVEPKTAKWYQMKYHKGIFFPIIKQDDKSRSIYQNILHNCQQIIKENKIEGKNVFLFVGRLVTLKNVKTVIEAFSKLDQEQNVLIIIGNGEEKNNLQRQAQTLNANVLFKGRLEGSALYVWYDIADIHILASYQESFGAVTNEALLAGCWCIISKNSGSQCLIENGKNGYTFDPMNTEELTLKMEDSLKQIKKSNYINLRDSKMLITYNEYITILITALNKM